MRKQTRIALQTDEPAPPRWVKDLQQQLPDGAQYWSDISFSYVPVPCGCTIPLVGKPNTRNRWTCRTCAGLVYKSGVTISK